MSVVGVLRQGSLSGDNLLPLVALKSGPLSLLVEFLLISFSVHGFPPTLQQGTGVCQGYGCINTESFSSAAFPRQLEKNDKEEEKKNKTKQEKKKKNPTNKTN